MTTMNQGGQSPDRPVPSTPQSSALHDPSGSSMDNPGWRLDHALRVSFPRVFSLLIGINDYTSTGHVSLRGAEPDAWRWGEFVNDLGGPGSHTTMLLGHCATRKAIIASFNDMVNNDSIEEGDPIIIFYAGHGGEVLHRTPDGEERLIQMLVPCDFSVEQGKEVSCISDLEIAMLIDRIAERKGDNITVILDCCHSASGTRGTQTAARGDLRIRSVALPPAAFNSGNGSQYKLEGGPYFRSGLRSHILLAACASSEKAHEDQDRGIFSTALLDLFRTVPLDQLRYCDILARMEPIRTDYKQNPQCEGLNMHRLLFSTKTSVPLFDCYRVNEDLNTGVLTLDGGSAHGITTGTQFTVYSQTDTLFKTSLATVTVESLSAFSAILSQCPGFKLLQPSVAIQVKLGQREELRLFIPRTDRFRTLFQEIIESAFNSGNFRLLNITLVDEEKSNAAHIKASMGIRDEVMFEINDTRVTRYDFRKRFEPVSTKDLAHIARVLNSIAYYYQQLDHANTKFRIASRIMVQFRKLNDHNESDWRRFKPEGPNLYRKGVVDFEVDDENAPYGLKLVNKSSHDLYPYLIFFVSSDLSIGFHYKTSRPCSRHAVESPFKVGQSITFGYGSSGVPPCTYKLGHEDGTVDFLKIVFATQPIDISGISQPSPFLQTRAPCAYDARFPDKGWDSLLIPIIQRKPRAK